MQPKAGESLLLPSREKGVLASVFLGDSNLAPNRIAPKGREGA